MCVSISVSTISISTMSGPSAASLIYLYQCTESILFSNLCDCTKNALRPSTRQLKTSYVRQLPVLLQQTGIAFMQQDISQLRSFANITHAMSSVRACAQPNQPDSACQMHQIHREKCPLECPEWCQLKVGIAFLTGGPCSHGMKLLEIGIMGAPECCIGCTAGRGRQAPLC